MSSRPQLDPQSVITNGVMANATITSLPTIIQKCSLVSYDISWSGSSPVGVITVEISNTYKQNVDGSVRVAGNWTARSLTAPFAISGSTGNGMIELADLGTYAIRIKYTKTSGTGTLNATICGKVT